MDLSESKCRSHLNVNGHCYQTPAPRTLSSPAMDAAKLEQLKLFTSRCKSDPSILTDPSLSFFRDYLQSLGAKLSSSAYKTESQPMGDYSKEVSDENRDASQEAKAKAMEATYDGKLEEAIEHLTDAILLNPTSAIMYATRASVYIKMKKPNAAIRDADVALKINPDSAKGYKSRGIARSMLGQWEEAAKDLHVASNIDFDEEISSILKKVEPNAHKIVENRRKYDKLKKEREDRIAERDRQRRRAEAKAAYEKRKKEEKASSSERGRRMPGRFPGGMPGRFPGGMPGRFPGAGAGGMPFGFFPDPFECTNRDGFFPDLFGGTNQRGFFPDLFGGTNQGGLFGDRF